MPLKEKERGLDPRRGAKGKENLTKRKVPTRGTVCSWPRRAITHKRIIIRLYLDGYLTPEIARRTKHSEEACDRYIRAFNKVRMLADRNMSVEEIARTLEMSSFTVKEYLNTYSEFRGVMVMQSNLCVHTKYENMDKIYLYPIWEYYTFHFSLFLFCLLRSIK